MADRLARTFQFRVALAGSPGSGVSGDITDGAFAECSGLDVEMDVGEYVEGGRNNGVLQRMGRAKVSRITLRRGMLHPPSGTVDNELWRWFQDVVDGVRPIRRYDGTVRSLTKSSARSPCGRFTRGLPAKLVGPQLNAAHRRRRDRGDPDRPRGPAAGGDADGVHEGVPRRR